jgi:hypothetical protein
VYCFADRCFLCIVLQIAVLAFLDLRKYFWNMDNWKQMEAKTNRISFHGGIGVGITTRDQKGEDVRWIDNFSQTEMDFSYFGHLIVHSDLCYFYLLMYTGVQHDFHIILCSCRLTVTDVTCGAGTASPSLAHRVFSGVSAARSLVFVFDLII